MAPKKAKKYGRKKDNKRKDEQNKVSELDKETYSIQIESLSSKLQCLQIKYQELETANIGYKNQLDELTANKRDIVTYLQSVSSKRADEIQELVERLEGLRLARENDLKAHDVQSRQLKSQYRETIDQLTSENIVLSGKLASLEEFKAQREETMAKIEELQNNLKTRDREHREEIRLIEKSRILEKDELKKEMSEKLEEMGKKFRQTSNRQMAETTRRAIEENVALTSQMETMEQKITAIVAENQNLIDVKQRQQVQIATLEGMEGDLHKRNLALSKVVKDQELKLREQETIISDLEPYQEMSAHLEEDLRSLQTEVKKMRSEYESLKAASKKTEAELINTRNHYDAIRVKQESMESVLCSASVALHDGIVFGQEEEDDRGIAIQRNDTLSSLLGILNLSVNVTNVAALPSERIKLPILGSTAVAKRSHSPKNTTYSIGNAGIVPLKTRSRQCGRTRTVSTQTLRPVVHHSSDVPPVLFHQLRAVKTAAYKILHEVKCPNKDFYGNRNGLIPRS